MFEWLETIHEGQKQAPRVAGHDSGEVQGSPVFPVSRFSKTPEITNRETQHIDYYGFPGSPGFPGFKTGGAREKDTKNAPQEAEQEGDMGQPLPVLLDAMAAILTAAEVQEMRGMAATEPDKAIELCRLMLAAPPFPSKQDAVELDSLIARLCELEPWLEGCKSEMLAARLCMAPARYAEELASFRRWVGEAEARGRPGGGGAGNPSR